MDKYKEYIARTEQERVALNMLKALETIVELLSCKEERKVEIKQEPKQITKPIINTNKKK